MKKLYFLNEEESKRILNLHKQATKKQYLSEQSLPDQELDEEGVMSSMAAGAAAGAVGGVAFAGVGAVPGAIIGGTIGLINGLINGGSYSYKGAEKILQACGNSKEVGKSTMNRATLNGIADGINTAVEGMGTDEDAIKSNLEKITTIPDLCAMANTYKTRHGETLFAAIDGDIDSESEWKKYVYLPLLDAYENSVELGKKLAATTTPAGWEKFSCVVKHPKAKVTKMSNGSQAYDINGVFYYNNGRKAVNGTMANYTCNDPEFSATTTTTSGGGVKKGGRVSNLQPKTKTIQSKLGVSQTGTMDQSTIDALMTKLNGSGTTTQAATSNTGTV
jgi:hypothetical protein